MAEQDSAQMVKKREKWKMPETEMPRRAYLSTSQRRWPTRNFQKNQSWKKERMRKNGNGTYRDDGNRTCSVCKRVKQGNQRFPGKTKNSIIKGRDGLWRKAAKKERNTRKKRFSRKTIRKICGEEKILREKQNITSRYPVKVTIAHTRIQRESNFARFEGWNSHSRL